VRIARQSRCPWAHSACRRRLIPRQALPSSCTASPAVPARSTTWRTDAPAKEGTDTRCFASVTSVPLSGFGRAGSGVSLAAGGESGLWPATSSSPEFVALLAISVGAGAGATFAVVETPCDSPSVESAAACWLSPARNGSSAVGCLPRRTRPADRHCLRAPHPRQCPPAGSWAVHSSARRAAPPDTQHLLRNLPEDRCRDILSILRTHRRIDDHRHADGRIVNRRKAANDATCLV